MVRGLGALAVLTGILLIPLGLSGPTAWLLVPAHFGFTVLCALGAVVSGWEGRPEAARRFGFGHLVVSGLAIGALELAARVRGAGMGFWVAPWLFILVTGWVPAALSALAGQLGELRRRRMDRRARRDRLLLAHDQRAKAGNNEG